MNRRITALLAAGTAGAFALALPLTAAPKGTNHNTSADDSAATCSGGAGNSLTIHAPEKLWPPNHKYYTDIYALAQAGTAAEPVELTTTGYHDQYDGDTEVNGSGNTGDDITSDDDQATVTKNAAADGDSGYPEVVAEETGNGSVQTDWKARAERSGRLKEGRTYTLKAVATFGDGGTCEHTVEFSVPHDMRRENR